MSNANAEYALEKKQVIRSFGGAAKEYQQANVLQSTVAARLLERLDLIKLKPERVLDLGCGPGTSSSGLAKYYKKATVYETDISLQMLRQAKSEAPRFFSRRHRFCSDAEASCIKSTSIDLIFSNLMLQWVENLDTVFSECGRILKPNSLFIFSTFGPDTLIELRKSWQEVDEQIHVNAFVDMHDIGDALIRAGMQNPVMEAEKIVFEYEQVHQLMRDLKKIGAHNVNQGRRKTLTGKSRLNSMLSHYEKLREEGRLPASYEVVYGHAWTPEFIHSIRVDEHTYAFPASALTKAKDIDKKGE
jgi:malonyl-CoA O-methyltransferase